MTMTLNGAIANFEDRLFATCLAAFEALLRRDAACEATWKERLATINRHGLLAFVMPNPIKAPPIEIDHERLNNDPVYRRRMAKKLAAPRPGKTVTTTVTVERERLLADGKYLSDICKLLTFKWVNKLLPVEDLGHRLMLLKTDEKFLANCLAGMGPHHVEGETIARRWLREEVEAHVDRNPRFIAACDMIREVAAREKAAMAEFCAELRRKTMEDFTARTDEILAAANRDADEYLAGLKEKNRANAN